MPFPTPTMPGAGYDELLYCGAAMAQLRILRQQMALAPNGGLREGTRGPISLDNGVTCFCRISFLREEAFIHFPEAADLAGSSGIIFHPRSGAIQDMAYTEEVYDTTLGTYTITANGLGVAGGWENGKTLFNTEYLFPLVDEDNASFLVNKVNGAISGSFSGAKGNYGNLYYRGSYSNNVISWRGSPTRHFRLSSAINIPGLSLHETSVAHDSGDTPEYTTFGTKLYKNGRALLKSPTYSWPYSGDTGGKCLILGAAINGATGLIYTVCHSDRKEAPGSVMLGGSSHPLRKPGFYLTLWRQGTQLDGWDLVSETYYGRNGLPWFGNASGTVFVCGNGDVLLIDGSLTTHDASVGSWHETATLTGTVTESGGSWPVGTEFHNVATMSFAAQYSGKEFYDFKKDEKVFSAVDFSFSASSSVQSSASVYKTYSGDFPMLVADPGTPVISGPMLWQDTEGYSGNYSVTGGEGPYTWSFPSGSGCGTGTVSVSDCKGKTASMDVRMPSGYWSAIQEVFYDANAGDPDSTHVHVDETAGTKTTYVAGTTQSAKQVLVSAKVPFQGDCTNCVDGTEYENQLVSGTPYGWIAQGTLAGHSNCCGFSTDSIPNYRLLQRIYMQTWICP
jgi:hypothetical protein